MSTLLFKGGKRKILRSYLWKLVEKSYENTKKMYQTEPLDLSVRGKSKILSVIDLKFLAGLNDHLAKLYERTTFVDKSMGSNPRGVKTVLPCQVCFKTFDRPSLLKRHMRTHTGEKPHVCNVCSKGFSTSSSLNTHRRIHTGEKPHKCPDCGKCFTASSNLYYHRMTHTKNKPHKCMWCPRSFPTPGELRAHVTSHDLYNNKYAELQQNRHRQVKFDYNK